VILTHTARYQGGVVTIFVSMILLVLITLLVLTAFSLSRMNLQATGNAQVREEGLAAANMQIDRTIDSEFWNLTTPTLDNEVRVDGDGGATTFLVDLAVPRCVRASEAPGDLSASVTLPGMSDVSAWNTIWELDATAREAATGTEVRVVQGIRLLLSTTLKEALCDT